MHIRNSLPPINEKLRKATIIDANSPAAIESHLLILSAYRLCRNQALDALLELYTVQRLELQRLQISNW